MPTTSAVPGASAEPNDFYDRYVCGLMASATVSPVEHAVLRVLAVRAPLQAPGQPVVCSLAALAECLGRDGAAPDAQPSEAHNRQVREAYKTLRANGLVQASVKAQGRGFSFRAFIADEWKQHKEPAWPRALGASKCMTLQVSPVGPTGERDYHKLLWEVDSNGVRTGTLKDWSGWLGISSQRVRPRLATLVDANIGVTLEALPPAPREQDEETRGRKALLYRVTMSRLPAGRFPDGAERHRIRMQQERELVRQV